MERMVSEWTAFESKGTIVIGFYRSLVYEDEDRVSMGKRFRENQVLVLPPT